MKRIVNRTPLNRTAIVLISALALASIVTWAASAKNNNLVSVGRGSASETSPSRQKPGGPLVRSLKGTTPWINFQEGRLSPTTSFLRVGSTAANVEQEVRNGQAQALSLTSDDLNRDGFPDLVVGYRASNGGVLAIRYSDPEAFGPTRSETIERIARGDYPAPFLPTVELLSLPEAPDFLAAGDFDRSGRVGIIAAARGGHTMYFVETNRDSGPQSVVPLSLPGEVTAFVAGQINRIDTRAGIVLGLNGPGGPSVLVYGAGRGVRGEPIESALPSGPTQISLGRLDEDATPDLAIVAGNQLYILHGSDPESLPQSPVRAAKAGRLESVPLSFSVRAAAVGDFIWDRNERMEIAVAGDDGPVRILSQGRLDTRDLTPGEIRGRRQIIAEIREGRRTSTAGSEELGWEVAETPIATLGKSVDPPLLLGILSSGQQSVDLLAADPTANELNIAYKTDKRPTAATTQAATGRGVVTLATNTEPISVISMRLGVFARPGLVVLQRGQSEPVLVPAAPASTYTVNNAGDTIDATPGNDLCADAGGQCTLRAAIMEANAHAGADTINFAAGLNGTPIQLTRVGDDNTAINGDLDINDDLTITGNGFANTIIQGSSDASFTGNMGDKAFGINQTGTHTTLNVSMLSLAVRFTRNDLTVNGNFTQTGGGMDVFLTGTGGVPGPTIFLSNCKFDSNASLHSYGGGINIDSGGTGGTGVYRGTVQISFTTISNNKTLTTTVAGTDNVPNGGGLNLYGDKHDVTLTNSSITGNQTSALITANAGGINMRHSNGGTITLTNTAVDNNTAGSDGGGILTAGVAVEILSMSGGSITGNTATGAGDSGDGGGLFNGGNTGSQTTLTGVTISNNIATAGPTGSGGGVKDGSNGPLTLNNCTISGNSSDNGGGVATTNTGGTQTTTINNGTTISGNSASISGGGVFVSSGIAAIGPATLDNNVAVSGDGIEISGGAINCFGTLSLNNGDGIDISGGTFASTSGTLNLGGSFTRASAATFTHNSGTLNFNGSGAQAINGTATSEAFNNFTVNKGGGTLSGGGSTTGLTIAGATTLTAGTFAPTTITGITMSGGNWTNNGGVFTPGSSVVSFTNTGAGQNINGTNVSQTFNSITVAKTAQTLSGAGSTTSLTLNGSLLLTSGTFAAGTATGINVAGDWTDNGGTFTPGAGTVTFNGGGAQNLNGSAATQTFNDFTVSKGGGTLTGGGSTTTLTVGGDFTITAGTFAAGTITTLNDAGNWANGGTFTPNSSTVVFNGNNSTQTLTGTTSFNNLTSSHTGTGSVTASGSSLTVTGLMRVQAGTFTSSSTFNNVQIDSGTTLASDGNTMNVSGNWTNNGGTFTPSTGTVNFNGGGAQAINGTAASQTFHNFVVNKGGGTLSTGGSTILLTLDSGDLTMTLGTFTAPATLDLNGNVFLNGGTLTAGASITDAGNWTNNGGGFTSGSGTVTFDGTSQLVTGTTATTFNNLTVSDVNGLAMNNDNTVAGTLALGGNNITVANTKTLSQTSATASTGTGDVIGSVKRTNTSTLGTAYTFGNPNNRITTTVGTAPTDITVNLVKSVPTGFAGAVTRTYTITPTGGSGITATLRLHYLDAELNGNTEASLILRRFNGTGWAPYSATSSDTGNNWVENNVVHNFSPWTLSSCCSPTASNGVVAGRITDGTGAPVAGAVVNLSGTQARKLITDASGDYQFDNVDTTGAYTVTPARANYAFSPASRSFSQMGNKTEAAFTGTSLGDNANPLDTPEYFVRQEYVDILGREPDEAGFNFWSDKINQCLSAGATGLPEPPAVAGGSANAADCLSTQRINVAAAFFMAEEFQQSGSFLYDLYAAALGRKPAYAEYAVDRQQIIGGTALEPEKVAFAQSFVQRAEFTAKYQNALTAEAFVEALLQSVQATGVNLGGERDTLTSAYNAGADLNQSRAAVLRAVADHPGFKRSHYNQAFVLTEYFGYLRRDPDRGGNDFWLSVLNTGGNYRGLVCSFITSTEYQNRFSQTVSRANSECGQ